MGFLRKYGIYVAIVVLFAAGALLSPAFLQSKNLVNVLRQISVNGILAIGMTFVILTEGIDLSVGAILAIAGVTMARLQMLPAFFIVVIGVITGSLAGFLNGLNVAYGRIPPFIATLALMTSGYGVALLISRGMPVFIDVKYTAFIGLGNGYNPILFFIIAAALADFMLKKTGFGKFIYALGGNEEAARLSGVAVKKIKLCAYMISGFLAALAGVIVTARLTVGEPNAGKGYELDAIAAAVIGGTSLSGGIGGVRGTVAGALIIGLINNIFNLINLEPYYQYIFKGLIILGALYMEKRKK
ncbi:RbsC protein [Candidatus Vecturithrix granuli]|uniref:RbsC protein n=1 Tax=Vecturithrix granuli TaxID=1499967 RepID=A0A081C8E6_VECG1|nr:RbsC protein [Candidatus Vecturithrix granuli]